MWQKAKNIYHLCIAVIANIRYGFPGRRLIIIGVTGTDGKTTTVSLIYHILKTAGKSVSMISTVGANIAGKPSLLAYHVTTPSSFTIQKFLHEAIQKDKKENIVTLEVSSHAIDQFRIWGIPFAIGIITNVTNEHLDYHKTYDKYLKTKAKLLQRAKIAIVNRDDASYVKLLPLLSRKKMITYGIYSKADINFRSNTYESALIGEFNTYNILAAVSVCKTLGILEKDIKKGIETFESPLGRMNEIPNKKGLRIIVDYAHTPNGLFQVLTTLKKERRRNSRIISIIGAEGYRDPAKRPALGETAARLSDIVIITAVDPRGQEKEINEQILLGAKRGGAVEGKTVFVEPKREDAILLAVSKLSRKGDIVGIFGKGHERSINYDGHEEPWSDTDTVVKIVTSQK